MALSFVFKQSGCVCDRDLVLHIGSQNEKARGGGLGSVVFAKCFGEVQPFNCMASFQ